MNQYQPYSWNNYNPYAQQMPMYQQMQAQGQPQAPTTVPQMQIPQRFASAPAMSGRFVNDQSEINANDVPMTGSYALFPKNDMSEIYAKAWNSNGQIDTLVFKVEKLPTGTEKPNEAATFAPVDFTEVNERLDRIEQILANKSRTRKDTATND